MSASGVEEFEAADDLTLLEGMARAARLGLPVAVHAESEELTRRLARRAVAQGRVGMRDYLRLAARRRRARGDRAGHRVRRGDRLRAARRPRLERSRRRARGAGSRPRGRRDVRDVPALPRARRGGRRAPGRAGQVRAAAAQRRRARGAVGGAAAPATSTSWPPTTRRRRPALKEGDDLFAVWGGIAGAQTLLALLYDEGVWPRGLTPARWPSCWPPRRRAASAWPRPRARSPWARTPTWRWSTRRRTWTVSREDLLDRHRLSPFVGRTLRGRVVRTILRGQTVARDGRIAGRPAGAWCAAPPRLGAVTALHEAIAELAQFNDDPAAGGITREVYTPTYATALEWVAERMRAAGLQTRLDAVGNLFGRWAGADPGARVVLTGSHVDTTLNAGALRRRPGRARRDRGGPRAARGRRAPAALDRARRLGGRGAALRDRLRRQPRGRGRAAARGPRPPARP